MFWLVVRFPEGEMDSQRTPPPDTAALAENGVGLPAVTERICDEGAEPPAVALNVNELGVTVIVLPLLVTVRVTGTVWVLEDVASRMDPWYVPAERFR